MCAEAAFFAPNLLSREDRQQRHRLAIAKATSTKQESTTAAATAANDDGPDYDDPAATSPDVD